MERTENPVDLRALGAELRELRRAKGMSTVRFASELDEPVWLIDVIEHSDDELSRNLCSLLPKRELEAVQRAIQRLQSAGRVPRADTRGGKSAPSEEQTFYLPVTISHDGLMDAMDLLMLFASDAAENDAVRQRALRQGIKSLGLLLWLQHMQYKRSGNEKKARQCLRCFCEDIQARLRVC